MRRLLIAALVIVPLASSGCSIAAVVKADHAVRAPHQFCQELKATSVSAATMLADINAHASVERLQGDFFDWQSRLRTDDSDAPSSIKPNLNHALTVLKGWQDGTLTSSQAQTQTSADNQALVTFYGHNC